MILELSDVKIGKPTAPTDCGKPINYKGRFKSDITKLQLGYPAKSALKYICDTIPPDTQHFHTNYMGYLEKCWADHLGVVVTPDLIWYELLSEVALLVKESPEQHRRLFSRSGKTEDIIVLSGDPFIMPLGVLATALKSRVPSDADIFFPEFSTRTERSLHASKAAFCDICSPYYNYTMLLCGIPTVDVRGDFGDWERLQDAFAKLANLIGASSWTQTVSSVLSELIINFSSKGFWKNIFRLDRCGSGSEVEVSGWFPRLFRSQPRPKYAKNYSTHVSVVKYKQLPSNKNYEMSVGVFGSRLEGDFMIPDFSYVIHEVL